MTHSFPTRSSAGLPVGETPDPGAAPPSRRRLPARLGRRERLRQIVDPDPDLGGWTSVGRIQHMDAAELDDRLVQLERDQRAPADRLAYDETGPITEYLSAQTLPANRPPRFCTPG